MAQAKMEEIDMNDLVTRTQAAEIRGVSRSAIADLIKRGRLQPIEIAGRAFLSRREVEAFEPDPGGRPSKTKDEKASKAR
jgi:Transcriptional regulator, AbiEi antitoxin